MNTWIDVEDRMPGIHEENLLYIPSIDESQIESNYVVGYLEYDGNFYFNNFEESIECVSIEYITHWMPLPAPPTGKNK